VVGAISGPASAVRNQLVTFTGSFIDVGTLDVWTATAEFSDGSAAPVTINPDKTFSVDHLYTYTGAASVKITVYDDDGGSSFSTAKVLDLQPDPSGTGLALVIGGTGSTDKIVINNMMGGVLPYLNNISLGVQTGVQRVIVYAGDGDDSVTSAVLLPCWFFGQAGNDKLTGGAGDDLLIGGSGNDTAVGGAGRDVLVGGIGTDKLEGAGDDDIFIAGYTDYDWRTAPAPHEQINLAAWAGITKEWLRTDKNAATRVAETTGASTGGYNAPYYLNVATVHDDGVADTLAAAGGIDLGFFNFAGGGVLDIISSPIEYQLDI